MWLQGKRLVIIGGTTGLGLSAAQAFVKEGAHIVVVGRDADNIKKAGEKIPHCKALIGDASQPTTAEQAIRTCIETWGGFDGLYHVAGGSGRRYGDGPLHELTLDGWNQTLNLNLTSLMLSNQAAVRAFLASGTAGSILNMGSVLGFSPSPEYFVTHAYAAAKSAVIGFTRSLAARYAAQNIRVNVIAPALVETPMSKRAADNDEIMTFIKTKQPLDGGRIGHPDDCDAAALMLLSPDSKFITGQVLAVDGGWTVSEGQINAS